MALQVTIPLYLIILFDIWSGPALFPIFIFLIHLFISWTVNGPSVTSFINELSISWDISFSTSVLKSLS
jgi:uncharacterized membrane protein